MTVAELTDLFMTKPGRVRDQVNHHKIVAQAVHFGKWQARERFALTAIVAALSVSCISHGSYSGRTVSSFNW